MDRLLLIIPPYVGYDNFVRPGFNEGTVQKRDGVYRNITADIPMGMLSLSAYLKAHVEVEVRLIDFNIVLAKLDRFGYASFMDLYREVLGTDEWVAFAPTVVGISTLFTPSYGNMIDIARAARERFPAALITAGGGVPTNMHREIFSASTDFDALCYGEGELPMRRLLEARDRRDFLEANPAWITRRKSAADECFSFDFIAELDEIPFFDYSIVSLADYRLNPVMASFPHAEEAMRSMPIMTSRGCPHRCCFCASHSVHGRTMRFHGLARVREDLRRLKAEYNTKMVVFFDDHLMADRKRFFAIVEILHEYGLTAFFPASLALYALDRKVLEALKSVGLTQLVLSVESGSNRVLREIMHKPLDLSIVSRVIADCRDLGISADVAILIGLPGETKQDIEDTRAFLKTLDATWFRINLATPLVGSEMLEVCLDKNYLKGDYIGCDFKKAVVETEDFTIEYIQEKAYALNLELNFVLNSDFRLGNYAVALKGFENALRVKSDHALACYFAARCCQMLGDEAQYRQYRDRYRAVVADSAFWRNYAEQFALEALA